MEVAFNVAWGPLSQIAIPLIDVNSTVQLAVGAYGWWKARERSVSLVEMIQANGGRLAPSSTFNLHSYLVKRQTTEVRGIAWFDGRLESVPLPRASTGNLGDVGLTCLRAIATATLALYNVDATSAILGRVIPDCLINYDLEDVSMGTDGPFLACVRQFTTAVAAEEECNTLRRDIWRRVDEAYKAMFSASETQFRLDDISEMEVPIVIGLLKWILTSATKRNTHCYPTRSTTAWSFAVALSHLGFEVRPSSIVISSDDLYDQHISTSSNTCLFGEVYLVTCQSLGTDPLAPIPAFFEANQSTLSHRVSPIKAIPITIFRRVHHECQTVTIDQVCAIWEDAFEHAFSSFGDARLTSHEAPALGIHHNRSVTLLPLADTENSDRISLQANANAKLNDGPTFLSRLLAPQLIKHLPNQDWTPEVIQTLLTRYIAKYPPEGRRVLMELSGLEEGDWYRLMAVLLATIYAASCKSLGLTSAASLLVEVAVDPDILSNESRILWWIMKLGNATKKSDSGSGTNCSLETWVEFLNQTLAGAPIHLAQPPLASTEHPDTGFGYYQNGIFIIGDFLLRPSLCPDSLVRFHIEHGQPLQIPLTREGYVKPCSHISPSPRFETCPSAALPTVTVLKRQAPEKKLRIDLEPFWELDPQTVVFRVRLNGILKCKFSPKSLFLRLQDLGARDTRSFSSNAVPLVSSTCSCAVPAAELPVPHPESWKSMDISQLLNLWASKSMFVPTYERLEGEDSLCIHAGGDAEAQLLSVICFRRPVVLALRCFRCALACWKVNEQGRTRHIGYIRDSEITGCVLINGVQ